MGGLSLPVEEPSESGLALERFHRLSDLFAENDGAEEIRFGIVVVAELDGAESDHAMQGRECLLVHGLRRCEQEKVALAGFSEVSESLEQGSFRETAQGGVSGVAILAEDVAGLGDELARLGEPVQFLKGHREVEAHDRAVMNQLLRKPSFSRSESFDCFTISAEEAKRFAEVFPGMCLDLTEDDPWVEPGWKFVRDRNGELRECLGPGRILGESLREDVGHPLEGSGGEERQMIGK